MQPTVFVRSALSLGVLAAGLRLWAASIPLEKAPPVALPEQAARRFVGNFLPLPSPLAALSPDGKLIACTFREGTTTKIAVQEVDHPERLKRIFTVGTDADATPRFSDVRENQPLRVNAMRWVTPTRLVVEANFSQPLDANSWRSGGGVIVGVDADGQNAKTLLTPRDTVVVEPGLLGFERLSDGAGGTFESAIPRSGPLHYLGNPRILDFDPNDRDAVLVTAGDEQHYLVYSLNAFTGRLKYLQDEFGTNGWTMLRDREGRIRVALDLNSVTDQPIPYKIEKRRGLFVRWTPLDEIAGTAPGAPGFWVSPGSFFAERSTPVGFADGGNILYYASNIGRDTYGIYGLDLKTGRRTDLAIEDAHFDLIEPSVSGIGPTNQLVHDRFTRELAGVRYSAVRTTARWLDPAIQEVQSTFEVSLPGQSVQIQEWDETRTRFLAVAQSPGDPGGVYVFDRTLRKLWEFKRRAPWLDAQRPHRVIEFAFARADGGVVSGQALIPRFARLREVPVVFVCANQPWNRTRSEFSPQLRTLADMGFVAVQLNPRGTLGFGRKSRDVIGTGKWDEIQADDFVATLDELARSFHVHTGRAAILGEGLGAHLALRIVQLHPERFRAAIAINPVVDIGGWIEESRWMPSRSGTLIRSADQSLPDRRVELGMGRTGMSPQLIQDFFGGTNALRNPPLLRQPETLTRPVFVLSYPGPHGAPRTFTHLEAKRFAGLIRSHGGRADFVELSPEFRLRLPEATAAVYRQIEDFLNANVYDFQVKLGPLEEREVVPE